MVININIVDKRPSVEGAPIIVCGNSDYTIEFTFDSEWDAATTKIARFVYTRAGAVKHKDVEFTGSTVAVPVLSGIREVAVGVYAGDLQTTTRARIPCEHSILCNSGTDQTTAEDAPTLPALIEQAVSDYLAENPVSAGATEEAAQIPSYWQTHLDEKIALIREAVLTAGVNKSAFFFYSDSHWSNASTYTAKMAPPLLKYLCKNTPINKTNYGGDIVMAEADDSDTMAYLWEWRNMLYGLPNHHSVVGNHDDGSDTNNLFSENYVYGYLLAPEESCDIVRGDGAMYYYIDNPAEKTRYLYLDTAYKGVTDAEQAFVKSALLSAPESWHIVAIAHAWYYNDYTTYPPVLNGFDTNAKILLDMFDNFNARSGEYADCTAWVEFCVGGHYHLDHVEHTAGGIPVIIVEADCLHDRSGTMPTAGTTDEAAVSAVIADYNEKTVKIIRVGRGEDYETTIEVQTVFYTNVIPLSIDSTGAIFNGGKGWADTSRIGSGTLESYIGKGSYYITGHIAIDPTIENTIRLRNIPFDSTSSDTYLGIAFYNSSFARVSCGTSDWLKPSDITEANGYTPVLDGTNIAQFTFKPSAHTTNTDVKYFAICASYIGDDSIITINEPIE